jgi:hypothetical protein
MKLVLQLSTDVFVGVAGALLLELRCSLPSDAY